MKKLISMTDFVLDLEKSDEYKNWGTESDEWFNRCTYYANFLKQPLEIGMFVPVDEDGNILDEPHNFGLLHTYPTGNKLMDLTFELALKYQKAKEKVLLIGIKIDAVKYHVSMGRNVEYFASFSGLELTESAIKQLGL
jgi:hypothetical protein